jgi:LacI family transcriptional regulator
MAAEHFLSAGFRNFAFVGHSDQAYSKEREAAFVTRVTQAGRDAQSYHVSRGSFDPRGRPWALDRQLCRWLQQLPTPVAIFACNDLWGNQLTEACRQVELRVPEDAAILGVDNDDLMCELSRPSLSSVQVPAEAVGYQAAKLLDGIMRTGRRTDRVVRLSPVKVVVRQSSDVLAVNDELLGGALRFIRQRAAGRLTITQVLQGTAVSRRLLERRFRQHLGRGIWEEIRRCRVEKACGLLAGSSLPAGKVAEACGFSSARHLSVTFRQVLNTTPTAYRAGAIGGS